MSIWADLKTTTAGWASELGKGIGRFKNKDFANAAMATCALVAAADGNIGTQEKTKTVGAIRNTSVLADNFEISDLQTTFNGYAEKLEKDFDFGKGDLLNVISKLKKDTDAARQVVRIGIIIGGADGNFDDNEKAIVREICKELGVDPADFNL